MISFSSAFFSPAFDSGSGGTVAARFAFKLEEGAGGGLVNAFLDVGDEIDLFAFLSSSYLRRTSK